MHSSLLKRTVGALLAVLAFGGVAAATAQAVEAPSWFIEGSRLASGETHYITAKIYTTKEATRFNFSDGVQSVSCLAAKLKEGVLLGASAGNAGTNDEVIEFSGNCEVKGNGEKCSVEEPIVTGSLKSELVETEKAEPENKKGSLLVLFEPLTKGGRFATLHFKGTCTVTETAVTGKVAAQVLSDPENGTLGTLVELGVAERASKSWLLNLPSKAITRVSRIKGGVLTEESISLTAFAETTTLSGAALVLLANSHHESEETKWNFGDLDAYLYFIPKLAAAKIGTVTITNVGADEIVLGKETFVNLKLVKAGCENAKLKTNEKCETEVERIANVTTTYEIPLEVPLEKYKTVINLTYS